MLIDKKLTSFRKTIRQSSVLVVDYIVRNHIALDSVKLKTQESSMCMFCGSFEDLSKEHVIPQWTYQGCPNRSFDTNINGHGQTYNKTTIPACAKCNNDRLNDLEKYVINLFSNVNLDTSFFNNDELENIIRWLETIDYKFQILNARKKFIKYKDQSYMPYFAKFPLTVLRDSLDMNPDIVIAEIRRSRKRLTVKSKRKELNSLQVFKSSNKGFYFFHMMDDYIFIELPQFKIALFHFYKRTFPTNELAQVEAKKIVEEIY